MRNFLKLILLSLVISQFGLANQDSLKKLSFQSEWRNRYTDRTGDEANNLGNKGFKGSNRNRSRFRNTTSGTMKLSDEFDMDGNFRILRNQDVIYGKPSTRTSEHELWETEFSLTKNLKLGNLDTKWNLGWENKTNRLRAEKTSGSYKTTGASNEIYFGPSFDLKLFGQKIGTSLQLAYFDIKDNKTGDYYLIGSKLARGKGEGWGINLNLNNSNEILKGKYGTLSYNINLLNKLRDIRGKIAETNEEAKSSVYLDYVTNLVYITPSFAGFTAFVSPGNEYEKHTAKTGYDNTFTIWTGIGYKKSIETNVGTITLNPSVKYSALERYTYKTKNNKKTIERNELRTGITVSLATK